MKPVVLTATLPALLLLLSCGNGEGVNKAASAVAAPQRAPASLTPQQSRARDGEIVQELQGKTARVELADGRTLFVQHNADGTARLTGAGLSPMTGRWFVAQQELCFDWPERPRECWPYTSPAQPGETVRSRSDQGQEIRTTLQ